MPPMPLAHVSWAIADNADRPAVDQFFIDVFGAQTAYEMLITPETAALGLDREERLMMVGDVMLIPIAPAGAGAKPDSPIGTMLKRNAGDGRWLGVALKVADIASADSWLRGKGFTLHYDPGMESYYFLIGRGQLLGMRMEVLRQELPGDPRHNADWTPAFWRDEHPLGIEGLQSIGLSAPSLEDARALFGQRLEWPELAPRFLPAENADCAAFDMGDTVLEVMQPRDDASPLAHHMRQIMGIYCLTFKLRDAASAATYLRGKGLELIGEVAGRFAIAPAQAHGRLIWFTQNTVTGYPALGSRLAQAAVFPA